jgi:signal transduction histidine kinase
MIAKLVVDRHGGRINVSGRSPGGTEVVIILPQ